ncbi:FAD-dependent 5-carboxymethylaminomethyl-2-thiouridine(34) oxidoreductase MnmC [Alcaligenaceae bacterium]|nr:FAD-dependent 5-carboxymethylaminomethyl-2-thiouridine(34) oxidoreductase MnmC [Alcaligenaceae bacterium]
MPRSYQPLIPATLSFNENGVPFSTRFGDVYHARAGALDEARNVFLAGNDLPERWRGKSTFTVCEAGFGLGHNFLMLWHAWRNDPARPARLHMVSFEAYPFSRADMSSFLLTYLDGPERRLAAQLAEAWPPMLPGMHRLEFEGGAVTLTLAFGPIQRLARQVSARVDAFFLDGFAPRLNPDMWSPALFGQMVRMANKDATVATWCCAGQVRRDLANAGFLVKKVAGFGGKREMTLAVLRPEIRRPAGGQRVLDPVAIIGGGLAGAGVAQALALRGHEVTVFDPVFAQGLGASHLGHLAAGLTPLISGDDDFRARLSRAGCLRALQRWQGLGLGARPKVCGTLDIMRAPEDVTTCHKALAFLKFPPDWVRWLDAQEASDRVGVSLDAGGLWFERGQVVRPERLLEALFSQPGIRCEPRAVGALRRDACGMWQLFDTQQRLLMRTSQVVLANARAVPSLFSSIPGQTLPPLLSAMLSMAGQVSYLPADDAPALSAIVAGAGYGLPSVQGRYVAGSTYEPGAVASVITEQGHREVMARQAALLNQAFPPSGVMPGVLDGWAGWRAMLSDRLPVVGKACNVLPQSVQDVAQRRGMVDDVRGETGLWLTCAYGSRGLSWAALAGDIIAARLGNEPVPLERELLHRISPR